jgi:hypothetical protein
MVDMVTSERKLQKLLADEVFRPAVVARAFEIVSGIIADDDSNRTVVQRLSHDLARLDRERENLTNIAANGGKLPRSWRD